MKVGLSLRGVGHWAAVCWFWMGPDPWILNAWTGKPEGGWARRHSGRPAVLRTAWGLPPCPAGAKLQGKARQEPRRRMGTNCVILGEVQSYGGQELGAGRWWDLKGLADKPFIALHCSLWNSVCVSPVRIWAQGDNWFAFFNVSQLKKTCDLILTVLGVIYIALEASASSVLVMLGFKRYFLHSTKWDDRTVVLLCRMMTDNFMPQTCILRADLAEEKQKKKKQKKRSDFFFIGLRKVDCFYSFNSFALWLYGMGFKTALCWIGSLF